MSSLAELMAGRADFAQAELIDSNPIGTHRAACLAVFFEIRGTLNGQPVTQ
jgi:hypothetical protein